MAADNPLYELRTYFPEPGRQADSLALIKDHSLENLQKHNIDLLGVWTPLESSDERVLMLVAHKNRDSAKSNWESFRNDPAWQNALKGSEKNGKKPVSRIEQVYLETTDYSPILQKESIGGRVFELRTYITTPDHLPNLNARFRDHTVKLFAKHGMNNLVYWTVAPGEKTTCSSLLTAFAPKGNEKAAIGADLAADGNALVYFLTHKSAEAGKASFDSFRQDADWQKALKASEEKANGSLTTKDGVKSLYLKSVDFSPIQ